MDYTVINTKCHTHRRRHQLWWVW